MEEKIKQIIDTEIRPLLFRDGGNIEFVEYNDDVLKIRFHGSCAGCEFSKFTTEGILKTLQEKIPEMKEIKVL